MERPASYLESDASLRVLLPVLGLMGGLGLGILRAWLSGATELEYLSIVVASGIIGSALGMGAVLASVYRVGPAQLRSVRSLVVMVVVAALVCWFLLTLLTPVFLSRP